MKRVSALFITGLFFMSACDIVEAPYKKENIQINSDRKVLIEDYTGHQCPNCPSAAAIIHDIKNLYEDKVVVIAVHSGSLAKLLVPPPFTYDFTTETGDTWCDYFELENSGFPNGMVNRLERNGTRIIPPGNWATATSELLLLPAEAELTLTGDYDTLTRIIHVSAETNIASPKQGEQYYLNILITEDSVIKPQKNNDPTLGPTPTIPDYVHMHVLRLSLTGAWGIPINPSIIDQKELTFTLDSGSDIVPEHCHIVAFISNSNKEVLQAEEVKLTE